MMKIAKSLAMIAFVAAIGVYATSSFFSDTETSENNTFTAGTIDIAIDGENPWTSNYDLGDLKPGEVGYINFNIQNVGENPVDVSKKLYAFTPTDIVEKDDVDGYACSGVTGAPADYVASSEPECEKERETEVGFTNNVETKILYDLSIEVYDADGNKVFWQTIYEVGGDNDVSLYDVYGESGTNYVALGMIPVGGYMLVTQSYHFNADADNRYQGDGLAFDMEILGEQLTGTDGMATIVLENKTFDGTDWVIDSTDEFVGTLKYETNGPEFVYTVSGKAQLFEHDYVLAIGYNTDTNVDTFVTNVITDSSGDFTVSGSEELSKDMMGVKAWLVPLENWNTGTELVIWPSPWTNSFDTFLWETSLVWYNDTDI